MSLELNRNVTSLSLDDSYVERRRAPLYFQRPRSDSAVYFGALVQADAARGPSDARVAPALSGFQGCLDALLLNGHELPLQNKRSSFAEVAGLSELRLGCVLYPDACERRPCLHAGSCTGLPSGGECGRAGCGADPRALPDRTRAGLPRAPLLSCRAWQVQRRLVDPTPQAQQGTAGARDAITAAPSPVRPAPFQASGARRDRPPSGVFALDSPSGQG